MKATDILKDEHRIIEQVLNCLEELADRHDAGQPLDRASALEALDFFRNFADNCHHGKEEGCLFPLLESRGFAREGGPTDVMRQEHGRGRQHIEGMMLALVRGAGNDDAAGQEFVIHARAYVRLLREHVRKEDQCLFPAADGALGPDEDEELLRGYAHIEHDEMGEGTHEDYLKLADTLADRLGVPRADGLSGHGHVCCHHASA